MICRTSGGAPIGQVLVSGCLPQVIPVTEYNKSHTGDDSGLSQSHLPEAKMS
jgi:hypothetical protein